MAEGFAKPQAAVKASHDSLEDSLIVGVSGPATPQATWERYATGAAMRSVFFALCLMLLVSATTGCASRAASPPRLEVNHSNYDAAFDAVLDTLRAEHFTLDRVDRRLGVISTRPRTSASIAEPWKVDNATVGLAMESTIHYQRRIVRVEFRAFGQGVGSGPEEVDKARVGFEQITFGAAPIFDAANHPGTLVITVNCAIERAQRPGMQIQPIALRESNITTDPLLAKRGIPARFWQPIDRDQFMETRIADRIARRAGQAVSVSANTIQN